MLNPTKFEEETEVDKSVDENIITKCPISAKIVNLTKCRKCNHFDEKYLFTKLFCTFVDF